MISRTVFMFDCWGLLTVPYHEERYHLNNIYINYAKVYGALAQSLMEPPLSIFLSLDSLLLCPELLNSKAALQIKIA